jgi:LITAF-like zinc ribbon domain
MAHQNTEKFFSPRDSTTLSSPNRFYNPEISEEPAFNESRLETRRKGWKINNENQNSSEYNSSSFQISTQQSLNLKNSLNFLSPKQSAPLTPQLLQKKIKDLQGQNLTLRLQEKLKDLENTISFRKSEAREIEPLVEISDHFSSNKNVIESKAAIEGEDDIEIPHLRWCAYCKGEVMTEIHHINTNKTFWASLGIFFSGGVLGCFLIPYVTNYCKDLKIVCHNCKRTLLS